MLVVGRIISIDVEKRKEKKKEKKYEKKYTTVERDAKDRMWSFQSNFRCRSCRGLRYNYGTSKFVAHNCKGRPSSCAAYFVSRERDSLFYELKGYITMPAQWQCHRLRNITDNLKVLPQDDEVLVTWLKAISLLSYERPLLIFTNGSAKKKKRHPPPALT